jgi:hypothetical protein
MTRSIAGEGCGTPGGICSAMNEMGITNRLEQTEVTAICNPAMATTVPNIQKAIVVLSPVIWLGPPPTINSLWRWQEKRTLHKPEIQIGNSGPHGD